MARVALTDDNGALYGAPATWLKDRFTGKAPEDALRWWRAQVGGAATAPADILVVSDSTAEGAGAGTREHRWIDRLLHSLRREYQPTGVKGGEGYSAGMYNGGTITSPWSYTKSPVLVSDEFNRTGEIVGSSPDTGGQAWAGSTGNFTLDGSAAVAQKGNATSYIRAANTVDREAVVSWHLATLAAGNLSFASQLYYNGVGDLLELRGVLSTTTSIWSVRKIVGGVTTTVASFATAPVPAGSSALDITTSIKLDGLTVTATVNGQTVTGTVTEADKTAFLSTNSGVTIPETGSKIYSYKLNTLTGGPVSPAVLGGRGLGVRSIRLGSAQIATTMTRTFTGTSVDVVVQKQPNMGNLAVTLDGATTTHATASSTVADGFRIPFTGLTSGPHTLTLSATGADVVVEGVMVYDGDETKGIRLWDGACSGAKASAFIDTSRWHLSLDNLFVPDLLILGLGLNDYGQSVPPEEYRANMQTIIDRVRAVNPDVSVVLHNSYRNDAAANPAYPWSQYLTVMGELAEANNAVVVDLNARMLGWGLVPASLQTMWVADKVHPSPQGNGVMKDAIYSVVKP